MRLRRSRIQSSRGHVRIEQGFPWQRWIVTGGTVVSLLLVALIVITQAVLPLFEEEAVKTSNRTWLEFAWTMAMPSPAAVDQLADRLKKYEIDRVYVEVAAWRADGSLLEGEYVTDFVRLLRDAYPDLTILVWLRMSGEEIADPERQAAVVALSEKAVRQWGFDGVQLNGRAVYNNSESYITLLRALRQTIGDDKLLSVTVPPDRRVADPDVPRGTIGDPDLTWDLNYKQRVGILNLDEMVVMAHASGLTNADDYSAWVAYQLENYAATLEDLDRPPTIIVALPTYDAAPEHDPTIETLQAAARGVKLGRDRAARYGDLFGGVGLYEYKTTDSREWVQFADAWLDND